MNGRPCIGGLRLLHGRRARRRRDGGNDQGNGNQSLGEHGGVSWFGIRLTVLGVRKTLGDSKPPVCEAVHILECFLVWGAALGCEIGHRRPCRCVLECPGASFLEASWRHSLLSGAAAARRNGPARQFTRLCLLGPGPRGPHNGVLTAL